MDKNQRNLVRARRDALKQKINLDQQANRIRDVLEALKMRGVSYRIIYPTEPEGKQLLEWCRTRFPHAVGAGVPNWPLYPDHVIAPVTDADAAHEWIRVVTSTKRLANPSVVVEHGNGDPALELSLSDVTNNLDILDNGFERWIMCPAEGWLFARDMDYQWGWAMGLVDP